MHRPVEFSGRFVLCGFVAVFALVACASSRELVGRWTAVDAAQAPAHMARLQVSADEITLDNGDVATYVLDPKDHTAKITFPNSQTYTYGYSRSGENMTLVDGNRRVRYVLDQG
jgi:hypothetical protein